MALILLADDEEALVTLLREHLEGAGHAVLVARDGLAAAKEARARRPELMILDINMPGIWGPDAFKTLDEEMTRKIPVIFISGIPEEQAKKQIFLPWWSHSRFFKKPVDLAKLDAAVDELLKIKPR